MGEGVGSCRVCWFSNTATIEYAQQKNIGQEYLPGEVLRGLLQKGSVDAKNEMPISSDLFVLIILCGQKHIPS